MPALDVELTLQDRVLEPEQAAAAYQIARHVSVTAGPGSGKTTVLVERYLHILKQNALNIDQIVAITFTNRAANEMRERLRQQLNQILDRTSGEDRRRWLNYKRTLDGAVITTIHGFCARLLREYPVEARVDPQFQLLDEHRAAMLLESVVEETLSEFITSGHEGISRLTLGVGRARLASALAQLYRDVRGQGLGIDELALKTAETHATEADHEQALAELAAGMEDFLSVRRTTDSGLTNQANVYRQWNELSNLFRSIPEAEHLADYCRAVESFRTVRPKALGAVSTHVTALDDLLWKKNLRGRVPQICLDLFARQFALEVVSLLTRIDERLNEEKQKLSALDFDDLELRALALLDRPEVLVRAAQRYRYFLVDEFQDTNDLQRQLLQKLALTGTRNNANLFIVGDRKQSIYGFRGADVDVFRDMTASLIEAGGESKPLRLNFRSQPPLINFFNFLFEQLFKPQEELTAFERDQLGYVQHEPGEAKREQRDSAPLVELMVTTTAAAGNGDAKTEQSSREMDAEQLAIRINSLVSAPEDPVRFSEIALLFRAMSNVQTYEAVFRRAGIPYQTVLGRGFYEREEITDLIQLLRFLDNKTDELALAAVLRSPLCGISDNALLALRCAPFLTELESGDPVRHFNQPRRLVQALRKHRDIAFINDDEHELLDRASDLINSLIARRHHYAIGELLRFAVDAAEYLTIIAATFEGPQRLENVHRLFTLAERFDRSGTHLIRDFVKYVEEFEAIGSRESEGQIDEAANAVRLMTIHQAKGLEFPIVIIPDLQRLARPMDNWVLLDRHQGLTLKVPDGRGKLVAGFTFNAFERRHTLREEFESMRLLYVAATRARDRLILSGTNPDRKSLTEKRDTWLKRIWQSLELGDRTQSGLVQLAPDVQIQLTINLASQTEPVAMKKLEDAPAASLPEGDTLSTVFPLIRKLDSEHAHLLHRFSVTQLINYERCPRQYYFDRVLRAPSADEIAVWNNAEAPEPPANLTATLKGAVIHRFCETYQAGEDARELLRFSLDEVITRRQSELADRLLEIDRETAVKDLLPLAENYIASDLFKRIEAARPESNRQDAKPVASPGLWSEVSFRLRRPLGVLSGAIDKIIVTRRPGARELDIEIVDFKTNRIQPQTRRAQSAAAGHSAFTHQTTGRSRRKDKQSLNQIPLDFMAATTEPAPITDLVAHAALDYRLQMQAYALAVQTLLPALEESTKPNIKVTLHFLEPNVEFQPADELLRADTCARAIDDAMLQIVSSLDPEHFPVRPALHCRMCNFLSICRYQGWERCLWSDATSTSLMEL